MRKRLFFGITTEVRAVVIIVICLLTASDLAVAQEVEHNYLVGPQFTNCDSLKIDDFAMDKAITMIRKSKYRFDQQFRLTRLNGLQKGEFYSCDNKTGYLVITFDKAEQLYIDVEKNFWQQLISSSDPEGFYLKRKSTLHVWNQPMKRN